MSILLHIAEREKWVAAVKAGQYRPDSLAEVGFIHFSLPEQIVPAADVWYRGRRGLVLLVVDPARVTAEIRFEDCYQSGQEFPHIYGSLPVEAVVQVLAFEPGPDGRFALPATLAPGD
ncbi:MAG TPA: DUF952 domain-containing protein [Anaerolineae bacterium]|jgi:uncharacterized protein (DUF952 family)|nr:DUF952 domain-containing protein [Anaerolineae bacterium]